MTEFNKAIVAAVMSVLIILEQALGWKFGLTEQGLTTILAIINPILVWAIPNKKPETEIK